MGVVLIQLAQDGSEHAVDVAPARVVAVAHPLVFPVALEALEVSEGQVEGYAEALQHRAQGPEENCDLLVVESLASARAERFKIDHREPGQLVGRVQICHVVQRGVAKALDPPRI
jgi:hypothetical protein